MMRMETESTMVPRLLVEAEAMLGRVTGLQRDRSWGRLEASLRGPQDLITGTEEVIADTVVVVEAAEGSAGRLPLDMLTLTGRRWRLIRHHRSYLPRRWRW